MRNILSELRLYLCNHVISKIPAHWFRLFFYRKVMGFRIASGTSINLGARFYCAGGLAVGENSVINENCRLDSRGGIRVGCNVSISAETTILTADHDPNADDFHGRTRPVIIGDYAFLGTKSMILPGVELEKGAIVAAGSVVTRRVESLTIVGGIPARPIGKRNAKLAYSARFRRLFQ